MIDIPFENLRSLGLTPALAQRMALCEEPPGGPHRWLRVTTVHRETLDLHDGCEQHSARCSTRLGRELDQLGSALAVGDWVLASGNAPEQIWVQARLAPQSQIVRRDADGSRHIVVSNVDTALLVMGLDLDFNLQRIERYLALARSSDVLPVVVLTKADVAQEGGAGVLSSRLQELRARVGKDVALLPVDARSPEAACELLPYVGAGQTLVLLGSSGAGKSTLTNTLAGAAIQDTGASREHDSRGKHTTTARSLHRLPGGACVIDTPGVRTLRPDVDAAALGRLFDDVATLAGACRFRDCSHMDEPGCAVRAQVDPGRLRNYHKLLRESRRDSISLLERRRQIADWKARGRAARVRLDLKRRGA